MSVFYNLSVLSEMIIHAVILNKSAKLANSLYYVIFKHARSAYNTYNKKYLRTCEACYITNSIF